MITVKNFRIGTGMSTINIHVEENTMWFSDFGGIEYSHSHDPLHVILAALTVGKYLKWDLNPHSPKTMYPTRINWLENKNLTEGYFNHHLIITKKNGSCDYFCVTKEIFRELVDDWNFNRDYTLIPKNAFRIIQILEITKKDPTVGYETPREYVKVKNNFRNFLTFTCPETGCYPVPFRSITAITETATPDNFTIINFLKFYKEIPYKKDLHIKKWEFDYKSKIIWIMVENENSKEPKMKLKASIKI